MPFVALNKSTGEKINIVTSGDFRMDVKKEDIICPHCDGQMIVVAGAGKVIRHFRHIRLCSSPLNHHPETIRHLIGKWYLYDFLKETYKDGISIDFEVGIPEANRIADVLVCFPTGFKEAHEVQLASITVEALRSRTADYLRAGVEVVWWLGGSADTPGNRKWCLDMFGDVRVLNFQQVSL